MWKNKFLNLHFYEFEKYMKKIFEQEIGKEKLLKESANINPEITTRFSSFIREKSRSGIYRVEVKVGISVISIDVFPTVFPPCSDYSDSSESVFGTLENIEGFEVADIGSGSGIQSIVAIMAGAKHVDAADINPQAVSCSKHNAKMNGLENKINVFYSDLFKNFPKKKYDLIIANLPMVDFEREDDAINKSLYDNGLEIHKIFFHEAKEFLDENGVIVLPHANLQSAGTSNPDYDFQVLEKLIEESKFEVVEKIEKEDLGYKWINYKIKLKK